MASSSSSPSSSSQSSVPDVTTLQLTLTCMTNGTTETSDFPSSLLVSDLLIEWIPMLLGPQPSSGFQVLKDGRPILFQNSSTAAATNHHNQQTLKEAGLVAGDFLVIQPIVTTRTHPRDTMTTTTAAPNPTSASVGLDFSSLLTSSITGGTPTHTNTNTNSTTSDNLNFSGLLGTTTPSSSSVPRPVSYPGMTLDEAMHHNPHPQAFVTLLHSDLSLFNQLNYYQPQLADKLRGKSIAEATILWRTEITKGSIRGAMMQTERILKEETMKKKLKLNPKDAEALAYFDGQQNQKLIDAQYHNVMENYPESMGKILMLYIDCQVNGSQIHAFVDSGAQSTIMTLTAAQSCGIAHLIDTRFAGQAVGVGTGTILGRIHLTEMKIGKAHFPVTITVMEKMSSNNDMKFLLGLDNLRRFTCSIDLEKNVLRFKLAPNDYMEAPFLHEKDLDEEKGGTQGFNADRANQQIIQLQNKNNKSHQENEKEGNDDPNQNTPMEE